jgi:hypothetical protein
MNEMLTLAAPFAAESFVRQAALNAVSPVVAALLGGLIVTLISQRVQNHRAEILRGQELQRSERERRAQISLGLMKTAFSFYTRLIELTRVEHHDGEKSVHLGDLPQQYQTFRIDARVLEEEMRVYLTDAAARWLWHGAVDMLSARYYRLAHKSERLEGLIATLAEHPHDQEIPKSVRILFPSAEELRWDHRETFHNTVMERFELMLTRAINLVVHDLAEPFAVDPVFLRPGRGSRLRDPDNEKGFQAVLGEAKESTG